MASTIDWEGASGKKYRYEIHPMSASFVAKAGNYVFAKETNPGYWAPVYIGQTENLSERFDSHHKIDAARRNGATHIHAHLNPYKSDRLDEETDLVRRWNPPCND
ncbi:MAG: GIY-YIG nuclease family protein [Hyphomonas sp.]|nr:GIY-YIG nuclease family protein [Hyphomonas sp.]